MFLILALGQALSHIYYDYDRIPLPTDKVATSILAQKPTPEDTLPLARIRRAIPAIVTRSLFRVLSTALLGIASYFLLLRQYVWHWTYATLRHLFTLPKAVHPTTIPPMPVDLMARFAVEALLLSLLWEFSNATFDAYVAVEPLKKGGFLTDEAKDPNGSLLAGLKAKKELPRNFAFWELVLISCYSGPRRAMIYNEIERPGGSAWSQIVMICLGELQGVAKRIQDFQTPPASIQMSQQQQQPEMQSLPKLGGPLKQGQIFSNPTPPQSAIVALQNNVGTFAKAHGQSPGAPSPLTPQAKKLLTYGKETIMAKVPKDKQEELSMKTWSEQVKGMLVKLIRSPVGVPFRQTFAHQINAVILGAPTGNLGTIVDAIRSISRLAVLSIKESKYGQVSQDVPNIIRTFTSTIGAIEGFVQTVPASWTDVGFDEKSGRRSAEVEAVLGALREGLTELLNEFGEYADTLGLSLGEMRRAKEAVAARNK